MNSPAERKLIDVAAERGHFHRVHVNFFCFYFSYLRPVGRGLVGLSKRLQRRLLTGDWPLRNAAG